VIPTNVSLFNIKEGRLGLFQGVGTLEPGKRLGLGCFWNWVKPTRGLLIKTIPVLGGGGGTITVFPVRKPNN